MIRINYLKFIYINFFLADFSSWSSHELYKASNLKKKKINRNKIIDCKYTFSPLSNLTTQEEKRISKQSYKSHRVCIDRAKPRRSPHRPLPGKNNLKYKNIVIFRKPYLSSGFY